MPLSKAIQKRIAYSKPIKINNQITLGLFDKHHKLIDIRICKYDWTKHKFVCPRDPKVRNKLQKKILGH